MVVSSPCACTVSICTEKTTYAANWKKVGGKEGSNGRISAPLHIYMCRDPL
jgi:hypothetical protein